MLWLVETGAGTPTHACHLWLLLEQQGRVYMPVACHICE